MGYLRGMIWGDKQARETSTRGIDSSSSWPERRREREEGKGGRGTGQVQAGTHLTVKDKEREKDQTNRRANYAPNCVLLGLFMWPNNGRLFENGRVLGTNTRGWPDAKWPLQRVLYTTTTASEHTCEHSRATASDTWYLDHKPQSATHREVTCPAR